MMMQRARQALLATVLLVSVGCSPKFYVPNTQNVPMISSRGQANVTIAGNGNQVEFQGAYGVSSSVALQVNAGLVVPKAEDNGDGGKGRLFEAGLGYFRNISPTVLFDVYALAGGGRMENGFPSTLSAHPTTTGRISADVLRFGVQPSMSVHRRRFSVSGSARISSLRYRNIQGDLVFGGEDQIDYLTDHKTSLLVEPALTLRFGSETFRIQAQVARSLNLTTSDFKQDESLATVGVHYRFR